VAYLLKRVFATAVTSLNNEAAAGSGAFHAVRRQADSDSTMEHVARINRVTSRNVFCGVCPEAIYEEPIGAMS
jgi:hypothetical protein